ncbi:hypothetical protein GCM10028895_40510 [Pontibacter rugosus]
MNIILFDEPSIRQNLLPLTFTRPVALMRVGIMTIAEKWAAYLEAPVSYLTQPYLQPKYGVSFCIHNLYINGAVCPDEELVASIRKLKIGEALYHQGVLVAINGDNLELHEVDSLIKHNVVGRQECSSCTIIREVWDIFLQNGSQIRSDFKVLTQDRQSQPIGDKHTIVYNEENIFIEEGAKIRAAVLNAEDGPIYIGKDAQVHEGAVIRGPFALCEGSHVNMGAKCGVM